MADWLAKQGDGGALAWTDTLTYSDGSPVDLTGASVKFVMRAMTATAPTINTAATIITPAAGTVSYTPSTTDTTNPGIFLSYWWITFSGGGTQRVPTVGYNTVEIQENLETANQTIVDLDDVRDYLNLTNADHVHDGELMRFITGTQAVIEQLAGHVVPKVFREWHDGGQYWIYTRQRPVLQVLSVDEWRGPIDYPQSAAQDPGHGQIYSYMIDDLGRIVRRSAGGGVIAFPNMPQSVYVVYQAGRSSTPDNVRLANLELIRANYQPTQQSGRSGFGASGVDVGDEFGTTIAGYFVPNRVRELLAPNKRAPSVA